jgi:glycosyltransferase involved in cell wall biosynthesis
MNGHRPSLLFIGSGPAMPRKSFAYRARFEWLSRWATGFIIAPVTGGRHLTLRRIGAFHYLPYRYWTGNSVVRNMLFMARTFRRALALHLRGRRPDVVIASNPLIGGMTAVVIAKLFGVHSCIEVNGNFAHAFKYGATGAASPGAMGALKHYLSKKIAATVVRNADMVKILYREQLGFLGARARAKTIIVQFPDFVPVSRFVASRSSDKGYILLLGYPWYLKGADILIQAFKRIAEMHPRHTVKIVGWCPAGREYFERLVDGHPRITLADPVYYDAVPALIGGCSLFVLPSRTEAMGRVLLEAMACRKPIVAAAVDGVPTVIRHGYNGMLFEKENVAACAHAMHAVLADTRLASRLARNGYAHVRLRLSEQNWTEHYRRYVNQLIGRSS